MSAGAELSGSPARVLAIGLDGADPRLVLRWTEDGTMPFLASLRREGATCELATPPGLGDDAVWGSFSTGVSPGRHGRFYFRAIVPGSYDSPYKDASWLKRAPFWSTLASSGRRVAVIDVPKAGLARETSVVQVADWRCHGRSGLPTSNPAALAPELIERFGDDATDVYERSDRLCSRHVLAEPEIAALLAELERSIEKKREASEWLLARGGWDLFLTTFKEAHCAGHLCWDEGGTQGVLRHIYRRLDGAVETLAREVSLVTPIFVFSCLGMGANRSGNHLLDAVLTKLEPCVAPRRLAFRRGLMRLRGSDQGAADGPAAARARRVVYALDHNEASGAIRVNVVGREPLGLVRRGDELDAVCDRLTDELLSLVDPVNGRPVVERVIRCEDEYRGEQVDALPDLLAVWRRDTAIEGVASRTVGEIRVPAPPLRPGNHVDGGILFARVPGLAGGVSLPPASIVDLAPTLAGLVGVDLDDVDGRPIVPLSRRFADGDRAQP